MHLVCHHDDKNVYCCKHVSFRTITIRIFNNKRKPTNRYFQDKHVNMHVCLCVCVCVCVLRVCVSVSVCVTVLMHKPRHESYLKIEYSQQHPLNHT